jgi:superfamily II DNA/RNA helicase
MTFDELGLDPRILSAVTAAGYTSPTPIQQQAIPALLSGRDVTGIAQTGTGKTAAFVLPMIHKLGQGRAKARMPRSLILEPTRELAAQVAENFEKYGLHYKLNMALLIGGVSFGDQDRKLTAGVDVLIATPGRLMDHFERGKLLLTGVQMLVIDEADRMLDMGFIPDIERICSLLPRTRQSMLFSATMPPEIARLAKQFQTDPLRIETAKPATTASTITQYVTHCPSNDDAVKRSVLRSIIRSRLTDSAIVFCNRKREVDVVAKSLVRHGFDAAPIHGDLAQSQRMQTLDRFRSGDLKLLVASDVAARGLDIPEVSQVFCFAPPPHSDDYVHRIGRTGRAGRKGESFTIVSPADTKLWDAVLKRIGKDIETFTPDDMESSVSEGRQKSSARKAGSDRPDRGRRRSGTRRSDAPPQEVAETAAPAIAAEPDPSKPPRSVASRPARAKEAGRPRQTDTEEPETRFRGMGDHVPAFLLRQIGPVKPASQDA